MCPSCCLWEACEADPLPTCPWDAWEAGGARLPFCPAYVTRYPSLHYVTCPIQSQEALCLFSMPASADYLPTVHCPAFLSLLTFCRRGACHVLLPGGSAFLPWAFSACFICTKPACCVPPCAMPALFIPLHRGELSYAAIGCILFRLLAGSACHAQEVGGGCVVFWRCPVFGRMEEGRFTSATRHGQEMKHYYLLCSLPY